MPRRKVTEGELQAHLREQLSFIEDSADAYDAGKTGEAKRIAVALRVLIRETKSSKSLLGQLGLTDKLIWNSAIPRPSDDVLSYQGLMGIRIAPGNADRGFYAPLGSRKRKPMVPLSEWWETVIFASQDGRVLTRADVVLTAADQDGGAHVDPSLDDRYSELISGEFHKWSVNSAEASHPVSDANGAAIRQIAHEFLTSFLPTYHRETPKKEGYFIRGVSAVVGETADEGPKPVQYARTARNELCPCGSGQKYKKCHGLY